MQSSRVSYAAQIIVESSMITWMATLIYAIATSRSPPWLDGLVRILFLHFGLPTQVLDVIVSMA
jgi:hypothetical protein